MLKLDFAAGLATIAIAALALPFSRDQSLAA